jgi:biopolymer transport protein ExbD
MPYTPKYRTSEIPSSSMADVAFLMLSFFMMTTVIASEKGLTLTLPEWRDQPIEVPLHERNLYKIHINSNEAVMIEGEFSTLVGLKETVKAFILNNGKDVTSSENPEKAIVSLKTDRGASHQVFVQALDEIQAAYYEIYAERVGMSVTDYRKLSSLIPQERLIIDRAKKGVPMNISLAE